MSAENSQKSKKGRPPILGANSTVEILRVSREQAALFRRASRKAGKDKSSWMRSVLTEAAQAA